MESGSLDRIVCSCVKVLVLCKELEVTDRGKHWWLMSSCKYAAFHVGYGTSAVHTHGVCLSTPRDLDKRILEISEQEHERLVEFPHEQCS